MLNKKLFLIIYIFVSSFSQVFGADEGYFDVQNGSEYLGFANMNKEFNINSLMNSAMVNDYKATKIFIASGADVNEVNIANVSALHLAARNYAYESAKVLIENDAKVNAIDLEGWTPLMRASLNGDKKIMELLISNGANIWAQNKFGDTALVHTAMADCYECGKLIMEQKNEQTTLVKIQARKSLNIAKKKYNKEFIDLLTKYLSDGTTLTISTLEESDDINKIKNIENTDIVTEENITKIIYKFLGKSITASELEEINRSMKINKGQEKKKEIKIDKKSSNIVSDKNEINVNEVKNTIVKEEDKGENQKDRKVVPVILEKNNNVEKENSVKKQIETVKVEEKTEKKFVLQKGKTPIVIEKVESTETTKEETETKPDKKKMKLQTIENKTTEVIDKNSSKTALEEQMIEKSQNIKPVAKPIVEEKIEEETPTLIYNLKSDENILNKK
ncbi:MAG TPA: ankyrin repeat domain-containing protein [Rickettsiales bacterium]|nr:ankyrin repeat domain-containing protein [Rickettsiales bacterium]